jgi:hypothetical protein
MSDRERSLIDGPLVIPELSNIGGTVADNDATVMQIKSRTPAHKWNLGKELFDCLASTYCSRVTQGAFSG